MRRGASPRPPLNIQIPPSRPSWILFLRSVGLLSVLIQTPAMALSKISLSSIKPKPEKRFRGHLFIWNIETWAFISSKTSKGNDGNITWIVNKNSSVLSTPDLIPPNFGIAASSTRNTKKYQFYVTSFFFEKSCYNSTSLWLLNYGETHNHDYLTQLLTDFGNKIQLHKLIF